MLARGGRGRWEGGGVGGREGGGRVAKYQEYSTDIVLQAAVVLSGGVGGEPAVKFSACFAACLRYSCREER